MIKKLLNRSLLGRPLSEAEAIQAYRTLKKSRRFGRDTWSDGSWCYQANWITDDIFDLKHLTEGSERIGSSVIVEGLSRIGHRKREARSENETVKQFTDKKAEACDSTCLTATARLELGSKAISINQGGIQEIINALRVQAEEACKCREGLTLPMDYGPTTIILAIHGSEDNFVGTPNGRVPRAQLMEQIEKLKLDCKDKNCVSIHVSSCYQTEGFRETFYIKHAHNNGRLILNVPTNILRPASVVKEKIQNS